MCRYHPPASVSGVDEVQSVANPGVDSRHQISIILDLMAYHAATGAPGFLFAVIDMVRGFPTALREDVYLAMRRAGIPGRLIAAIAAFDYGSAVSIKIAPNRYTRPIPVTRGMLEGGSGSPGKFTIQCAGLARAVRDLGCGVTIAIQRVDGPSLAMLTHPSNSSSFR